MADSGDPAGQQHRVNAGQLAVARMGWSAPWYTIIGKEFSRDFDVAEMFGLNVFIRDGRSGRTYPQAGRKANRTFGGVGTTNTATTDNDRGRSDHAR